jgi:hypothetical protein
LARRDLRRRHRRRRLLGRRVGGTSYIVQIDYNWARDFPEGSVVEIDGDSVGVLQRYGRSGYVTGFEVEPGDHTVRVVHPSCEGVPEDVSLGPRGTRLAILMADVDDGLPVG